MPQSLVQNYLHIVFSTKNLSPLITPEYENELFGYIAGISKKLESPSIKIGGHLNHIHILCSLSKNISLVEYCKNVKSYSSKWLKTKDSSLSNFYWQNGYGAFSISPGHVENLVTYISNQHEHHHKTTFKEEYVGLLEKIRYRLLFRISVVIEKA